MIRINLLPAKKEKLRTTAIIQLTSMAAAIVVVAAIFLGWNYFLADEIEKQEDKIADGKAEIELKKKIIGEVKLLKEQEERLKRQLEVIAKLERRKRGPVHVLDEIASNIPRRIWLSQFTEQKGQLSLTGIGLDNADISEFMRELQKSKYFKNVDLQFTESILMNSVTVYKFKIVCKVDYSA